MTSIRSALNRSVTTGAVTSFDVPIIPAGENLIP